MRRFFLLLSSLAVLSLAVAQNEAPAKPALPPAPHVKEIHLKHVLVIGETKGFEHDSVPDAMAAVYNLGRDSGLWDTTLRTDTEFITRKSWIKTPRTSTTSMRWFLRAPLANLIWTTARNRT